MTSPRAKGMRLERVMDRLANVLPVEMPTQGRDKELLHIQQLEIVADCLESWFGNQSLALSMTDENELLADLREMVAKPDNQWKKSDVKALLIGDDT